MSMALGNVAALQFSASALFGIRSATSSFQQPMQTRINFSVKPLVMRARGNAQTESAKIRNRRMQKKYNGTPKRPRLSVFCSGKQLYAMLVDDQNKNCLFYGSTLQKSVRQNSPCSTSEAAKRVGEELIKACNDLNIHELSSYDRNGFATGERIRAFEIAISEHGFLPR
ncbi:PREDICTED: 50S ribosomal L18 [Prunus dulcis]|uniref:PREDICTED: 50S ribosomal L18 n=1 Tax=Prunus dulcis TaxID=3755 RepID=A0A5E4EYC8_PRUDU|nr:50S ribosomal protein L18 isoform X2 [Prunus dulcis]VVA20496.1 PREDICTED: 50S ribosomal L18 [Prunus dulcis]